MKNPSTLPRGYAAGSVCSNDRGDLAMRSAWELGESDWAAARVYVCNSLPSIHGERTISCINRHQRNTLSDKITAMYRASILNHIYGVILTIPQPFLMEILGNWELGELCSPGLRCCQSTHFFPTFHFSLTYSFARVTVNVSMATRAKNRNYGN